MNFQDNETNKIMNSKQLAEQAVKVLLEKKGLEVSLFDVTESSPITDYYVNVTGRSSTQVASLADDLVYFIGLRGRDALRVEGRRGNSWILVDYGDLIVNVFDRQSRDFYALDRFFPEESRIDIDYLERAVDEKFKIEK